MKNEIVNEDLVIKIGKTLLLLHKENMALMRMLSYPKQEGKIRQWDEAFDKIWGKVE